MNRQSRKNGSNGPKPQDDDKQNEPTKNRDRMFIYYVLWYIVWLSWIVLVGVIYMDTSMYNSIEKREHQFVSI